MTFTRTKKTTKISPIRVIRVPISLRYLRETLSSSRETLRSLRETKKKSPSRSKNKTGIFYL